MDIDWLIQAHLFFQMAREEHSLTLRICRSPLAACITGTSYQAPGDRRALVVKAHFHQILFNRFYKGIWNVRNKKILPNGKAQLTCAIVLCYIRKTTHLPGFHPPDRDHGADIVQSGLRLLKRSDMPVRKRSNSLNTLIQRKTDQRKRKLLFDFLDEFRDAPFVDEVFEPSSLAIGAVTVFDENTKDGGCNRYTFIRFDQNPGIFRELLMPGYTSQFNTKIDSGFDFFALADAHGHKAYVVCICDGADRAPAFEGNIEFPRQVIHVPIVQDIVMNGFREGACIDQFVLVKTSCRRGGDIAHIVDT